MCVCVCLRLESSRDDLCVRADVLEREMTDLQLRNEELTSLAQEAQSLKDEMDILRSETRDASLSAVWRSFCVPHRCFLLQALVWPRQSPGGHGGDVQAQAGGSGRSAQTGASLEERNHVYMQRTCELEEEQRRANAIRSQLDSYKRQVKEPLRTTHHQHEDEQSVFITNDPQTSTRRCTSRLISTFVKYIYIYLFIFEVSFNVSLYLIFVFKFGFNYC